MNKTCVNAFGFILLMFTTLAWAAPVPDTGQTKCYNNAIEIPCPTQGQPFYGQDANYTINQMSYTKLDTNANVLPEDASSWAMVRDNVTGLIWEVKTNKDGIRNYYDPHDADNTYTWFDSNPATNGGDAGAPGDGTDTEDFIYALNSSHFGGFSDWRLPTVNELNSITKFEIFIPWPTINAKYFPNTQSSFYWSSTNFIPDDYTKIKDGAWSVSFENGSVWFSSKGYDYNNYVRAVRGSLSQSAYVDNGNGTVTDTSTGLMWQKLSTRCYSWENALDYCEKLTLAGYTDWRLPTFKELLSLVDYSHVSPAINSKYFPNHHLYMCWSSTSSVQSADAALVVNFGYGLGGAPSKIANMDILADWYVLAVRGGQLGNVGLSVSPSYRDVGNDAFVTTFSVSNTGTSPWTAQIAPVAPGLFAPGWLSITTEGSGSNSGTITCEYSANNFPFLSGSRSANIIISASDATGGQACVRVTQAGLTSTQTACAATLDVNWLLNIPYLSNINPISGTQWYFWADLLYEFNPTYPTLISFKLINSGDINRSSLSCAASTLSADWKIHIPDLLLPDGITHLWADLVYSRELSADVNGYYFVLTNYGLISD